MTEIKFAGFDVETAGEKQEYALQPFRALSGKAWLTAASFGAGDSAQGILNPTADQLRTALTRLNAGGFHITGWSGAFDAAWLIALGLEDLVFASRWMDGMLLWRHAVVEPEGEEVPKNRRKSYSLEAALKEFFPEAAHIKEFKDFQAQDEESLRRLLVRNKGDALFTAKLANVFWQMLTERQQRAAMIEAKCIPMVAWTFVNGIDSSAEMAQTLSEKLQKIAEEKERELMASSPEAEGVNLGSPKQLQKLLFDDWGLPVIGTSKKTGDPSTDKFALFDLALMDPRARLLKEIREAKNNRTKYAEATLKSLEYNGDGKVRPRARIFGTYTSRMTYSSQDEVTISEIAKGAKMPSLWLYHGESESFLVMSEQEYHSQPGIDGDLALCAPLGTAKTGSVAELKKLLKACGWEKSRIDAETRNLDKQEIPCEGKPVQKKVKIPTGVALHQWKRGKDYRRLIRAPEGYTLLELDAAGQEFRWMAVASRDETMLGLCAPGEDAHSFMGAQVAGVDYRELIERVHAEDEAAANERKCGKFCNLSYQYRVSAPTATKKARVEYEMDVDEPFIRKTQAIYKASYPGVPQYWRDQITKCKSLQYAETFAGRRVQLKDNWAGSTAWAMESTAINYPIQGTGGDQKYLALAIAKPYLPRFNGHFYYELHDGLFFIFPDAKAEGAAHFFKRLLSNLPYKAAWGIDLPIAFPFDAKMGKSWGDLKEIS